METLRYFMSGRPFRFLPTNALYFLVVGQGLILLSNTVRQCCQPWPVGVVGWSLWVLPVTALLPLALVVQAAVREYLGRTDRPRRFWHIPDLQLGSGEEKTESGQEQFSWKKGAKNL